MHISNNLVNTYLMAGKFHLWRCKCPGSNLSDFVLGKCVQLYSGWRRIQESRWSPVEPVRAGQHPRDPETQNRGRDCAGILTSPTPNKKGGSFVILPGTRTRSVRFPNAPPGMLFGGDPGCPKGGSLTNALNFAPRLGFAYELGHHTVLRGGGGIYYSPTGNHESNGMVDTAPFSPQFNYTGVVNFANPYRDHRHPQPIPGAVRGNPPAPMRNSLCRSRFTERCSITGTCPSLPPGT